MVHLAGAVKPVPALFYERTKMFPLASFWDQWPAISDLIYALVGAVTGFGAARATTRKDR